MALTSAGETKRIHESILARGEARVLRQIASILPAWLNSDHLTMLGFLGTLLAGGFYALSGSEPRLLHLVNLAIFLNWLGDSLDGTLARVRSQLRPRYGYYVDHILDSVGVAILIVGLVISGHLSERVAAAFLVAYLLVNIHIYLATSAMGVFKISFGWFGPTELRIALVIGNLFLIGRPEVHLLGRKLLLFDVGAVVGTAVLAGILIISSLRVGRQLYVAEPIRKRFSEIESR